MAITKEEYLRLVVETLNGLKKQKSDAMTNKAFYEALARTASPVPQVVQKGLEEAENILNSIDQKIETLKELVNLPAYVRLQTISSEELENYKKEKIEESTEKIRSLESEVKAKEEQIQHLIEQLEKPKADFKEAYLNQSRDQDTILNEQAKPVLIEIEKVSREIDEINKKIETEKETLKSIQAKPIEEIRKDLVAKVEKNHNYSRRINSAIQALSSIQDEQRAQELVELLKLHDDLVSKSKSSYSSNDKRSTIKIEINHKDEFIWDDRDTIKIERKSRSVLDHKDVLNNSVLNRIINRSAEKKSHNMTTNGGWGDPYRFTFSINDADRFIEIVNEEIEYSKRQKEINEKEITEEKLGILVKRQNVSASEINESLLEEQIAFLTLHKEKIGEDTIKNIEMMIKDWKKLNNYLEKKNLIYGIIKKNETEEKLEELTAKLSQILSECLEKISNWYRQHTSFSQITYDYQYHKERKNNEIDLGISLAQQMIEAVREKKKERENEKEELQKKTEEVLEKIESIVGPERKKQIIEEPARISNEEETVYESRILNQVEEANKQLQPMSADEIDQMLSFVDSTEKTGFTR